MMFRLTDVVRNLLIINVLFFIANQVFNRELMGMLALHYPASPDFRPWQLVTYFFMHSKENFGHILFNMLGLVMFGSALEAIWGARRFLFYYIACALGAAALHIFIIYLQLNPMQEALAVFQANPNYDTYWNFFKHVSLDEFGPEIKEYTINIGSNIHKGVTQDVPTAVDLMQQFINRQISVPMVGASGAIFGLLLAFGLRFPENELMIIPIPVPIKAKYFIPILIVMEFFLGVQRVAGDNVAHFAHLGGAAMGLLLIVFGRYVGKTF